MIICYDNRFEMIKFGVEILKQALNKKNIFCLERPLDTLTSAIKEKAIIISFESNKLKKLPDIVKSEGFSISLEGTRIYITGKDSAGAMYGLLDIAETIELYGMDAVENKVESPFMAMRGIKFNLPYEPYDTGDPFEKNIETCKNIGFWNEYIDFLAVNRYNCLSLWSEHPFHMMFRLEKYPDTCPYTEEELNKYKELFKFIIRHAKNRGIRVFLITWNIRLTDFVAKGLGLPSEIGDMSDQYNTIYNNYNHIPTNIEELNGVRQHLNVVKDYFIECIKTLLMTYTDLAGIGTTSSEEMVGDAEERQKWVAETYITAVKEVGKKTAFIHRTNCSNGKITKKIFIDEFPYEEKYISWKYSNAHMYSYEYPNFEEIFNAWEGLDLNDFKVIYTIRNDDIHTLRWGDCDYIKRYITGMNKPYVHGYYWGADGYIWASDFQHVPNGHKTWKYDYEKHWYQFALLGRLGYQPDMSEEIWIEKFKKHYGVLWGEKFYRALKVASGIIPAINRLFWINYDFEWHPESLLSVFGFKTILDFVNGNPMPGSGTIGIRQYVNNCLQNQDAQGESPIDIIRILDTAAEEINNIILLLKDEISRDYRCGDIACTLADLEAWKHLGKYFSFKFSAALELIRYEHIGNESNKTVAVDYLKKALIEWRCLSLVWSSHYLPYKMVRTKHIFGWSYYLDNVEMDIDLAAGYEKYLT